MYASIRRFNHPVNLLPPEITFDWQTGLITMTNPNSVGTIYYRKKNKGALSNNRLYYEKIDDNSISLYNFVIENPHTTYYKYTLPLDGMYYEQSNDNTNEYFAVVAYKNNISSITEVTFNIASNGGLGWISNGWPDQNKRVFNFSGSSDYTHLEYAPLMPTVNSPIYTDLQTTYPYYGTPQEIIINCINFQENKLPYYRARSLMTVIRPDNPVITYDSNNSTITLSLGENCSSVTLNTRVYGNAQNPTLLESSGAYIFYTTDGTDPEKNANLVYKQPFAVTSGTTIKAMVVVCGTAYSLVETYVVP